MVWIAVQRQAKISGLGAHGVAGRVAMVFYNLGSYEAQTGRFAEALAHVRKAYALDPRFSGSVKELAEALAAAAAAERKAGRPDQAMTLYQEALTVQPANAQALDGFEALSAGRRA